MFGQVKKKKTAVKNTNSEPVVPPRDTTPPKEIYAASADDDPIAYLAPQIKAAPKDGYETLQKWFQANYKYPVVPNEKLSRDEVLAIFAIEKDGSISNIRLALAYDKSYYPSLLKVLQSMEKWTPAKYDNKDVRSEVRLNFKLDPPNPIQVENLASN